MTAVDVLAVMDGLCDRYIANRGTGDQFISCVTPNVHGDDSALRKSDIGAAWLDLTEARAAVAELMELSRSIHGELRALEGKKTIPRMTGPVLKMLARDLDAALARCKGEGA